MVLNFSIKAFWRTNIFSMWFPPEAGYPRILWNHLVNWKWFYYVLGISLIPLYIIYDYHFTLLLFILCCFSYKIIVSLYLWLSSFCFIIFLLFLWVSFSLFLCCYLLKFFTFLIILCSFFSSISTYYFLVPLVLQYFSFLPSLINWCYFNIKNRETLFTKKINIGIKHRGPLRPNYSSNLLWTVSQLS